MKILKSIIAIVIIAITISSCKKSKEEEVTPIPATPAASLVKIGETYIVGAKAKAVLYSKQNFQTGYNVIYVAMFDSVDGSALLNGHFDIIPMMNMGTMQHSSPVENSEDTVAVNGYFKSAVVFSMPGTAMEWSLNLSFHNHKNNLEGTGSIGVNVVTGTPAKFKSTVAVADSNAKVFISLIAPEKPQVGINYFEIVLHKKTSMMNFPAIENYTVEIEPVMPSMGHGSPNNVNPVHMGMGHYLGKVNFTMTGLWNVNLKLYKNGILVSGDQYFELTL
jgi:hypothetical protein